MLRKRIDPAFGRKLAEAREGKGLSQAGLAEASGVPLGTIREVEQGKREPLFGNMQKLRAALGLDLNALPPTLLEGDGPRGAGPAAPPGRPRKGPPVEQD